MGAEAEFTPKEVALHTERNDCWMAIRGEVYDVTKYLADHPGGVDIMLEFAGKDATEAFENAGHSEDADEIMADYRIGALKGGAARKAAAATVRVALKAVPQAKKIAATSSSPSPAALGGAVVSLGALAAAVLGLRRTDTSALTDFLHRTMHLAGGAVPNTTTTRSSTAGGFGFGEGFVLASALAVLAGGLAAQKLSSLIVVGHAPREQPHRKMARVVARPGDEDRLARGLARGFLDPRAFQPLPLARKELVAPGVYRLLFELPSADAVLGLPTGQHVAIKASVPDGNGNGETTVQRSYTPVSNDGDRGVLDLVVRVYPDGLLTGRYLANLAVGDEVLFRGPKGAMRYRRGLCRKVGMLAGGTGITPMYQLIRAICEDPRDTTEVSLVYACRAEGDILLRDELEAFARRYPGNLRSVHYLLDDPPAEGWAYGTGYVTKEVMAERFPDPREEGSKVMLCGPPGMVNAAKKGLVELGYEKPSLASKMTDQIFCF